jgi:DNA binding domain, excisionase family
MKEQNSIYHLMFRDQSDVLHVKDVQKILSISKHQVYHLIESGKIRGVKVGKSYKIPKVSVIDYLVGEQTD